METSPMQKKILEHIASYWEKHGFSPSIRDLMRMCKFKSPRAVSFHLEKMEKGGLIEMAGKARTIRLRNQRPFQPLTLPIYGSVPAGFGEIQSQLALGEIEVPSSMATVGMRAHGFALKVRGDSMIDAGIHDGDIAIVEQKPAKTNDLVVALIDGQSTLKRLIKRNGGYALKAENPRYPTLNPSEELEIQGVVVGIFRNM